MIFQGTTETQRVLKVPILPNSLFGMRVGGLSVVLWGWGRTECSTLGGGGELSVVLVALTLWRRH